MESYGFEKSAGDNMTSTSNYDENAKYSVHSSIDYYKNFDIEENDRWTLERLQEEMDKKLVIEFPYYDAIWAPQGRNMPHTLKKYNTYISSDKFYSDFVGKNGVPKYSRDSMSVYFQNPMGEIAFGQDSLTFFRQMSYMIDTLQLKGIGMNSLGYFLKKPVLVNKKIPPIWRAYANSDSELVGKKESFGWIIAYFIVAFIPIGFVFSVGYYWQVRNCLAKHKKYYNRFLGFFALFLFAFLVVADILPRDTVGLILGLILFVLLLLYILVKKIIIRSKKYVNALR